MYYRIIDAVNLINLEHSSSSYHKEIKNYSQERKEDSLTVKQADSIHPRVTNGATCQLSKPY